MSRIPILQMATVGLLPSKLKVLYYRLNGADIGKNVKIGLFSVIVSKKITIGNNSKVGALSFINTDAFKMGRRSSIGTMTAIDTVNFEIGHDSQIMEQVVIGGMKTSRSSLVIGNRVKIFPFSFLNPTEKIVVEDDVGIGGANYIFTHGTWQNVLEGFPFSFGDVTIRKGVWLPWRVFVLPGVEIGEYSTIGAGAVINRSIPPKSLAVGMPAKVLKTDGAHLANLSEGDRRKLFHNIIMEYVDWLKHLKYYQGHEENTDEFVIATKINDESGKVHFRFSDRSDDFITNEDVVVYWPGCKFKSNGSFSWFDLQNGVANLTAAALSEETRQFLSRYGIRFSIVGE